MTIDPPEKNLAIVPIRPMPIEALTQWKLGIVLPSDPEASHCYDPNCHKSGEHVVGLLLPHQWFYPGQKVHLIPVIYVACSEHKCALERIQRASFPRAPLLLIADTSVSSKHYALETLRLLAAHQPDLHLLFED